MHKLLHYEGADDNGVYSQIVVPGEPGLTKTAAPLHDEVQQFIAKLDARDDRTYALVNALGATELYGPNINADGFSIDALKHEPPGWRNIAPWDVEARRKLAASAPYGHTTFYGANAFRHHKNKPFPPHNHPSYGTVELSVWNDYMKRVELVVGLDHELCRKAGGWDIVEKLQRGEFLPVSMGCFPRGTLVTMADGSRKPIEAVQVGDMVLTHKGRGRRVTEVHRRHYEGDLYAVKGEAYEPVWCTEEHPWWTVSDEQVKSGAAYRRWKKDLQEVDPDWTHASCLGDHHLIAPIMDEVLTPDFVDRAFGRLFGYYLAEGHVLRDKHKAICGIELSVNRDDPVHDEIEELCAAFGTKNPPSTFDRKHTELGQGIYIFDARLARLCYEHGGAYAKGKQLSYEAMRWHPEMQREVLGAYANGDGHGPPDGSLKLSTASAQLAWQWLVLLPRLGILPSIGQITHKAGMGFSQKDTYEWVVHIGKQWAQGLRDVTTKVVPSEILRAKGPRRIIGRDVVVPLRDLSMVSASTEVFNLEVDEDESYCVHGLAVHNCKVKYDVCSLCSHKAATRNDYCKHMNRQDPLYRPNMILPDGRIIFVWNPYPRFFDISFVLIGADRTARVMALVSSGKKIFVIVKPDSLIAPSADRAEELGYNDKVLEKAASLPTPEEEFISVLQEKAAEQKLATNKLADIVKELPPDIAAGKAMPLLERTEPDLPAHVLDAMAKTRRSVREDVGSALATAAHLGIVLKPREFQRVMLVRCGNRALADSLDERGAVFPPTTTMGTCPPVSSSILPAVLEMLRPLIAGRSIMGPPLRRRLSMVVTMKTVPESRPVEHSAHPLLGDVSQAYNDYRRQLMGAMGTPNSSSWDPRARVPHDPLARLFERKPVAIDDEPLAGLFTVGPVVYLIRAHWDAGKRTDPGLDQRIVQNNPQLVAKLAFAAPA